MTKSKRILRSAEHKIHQHNNTKEWCGYLTTSEALALLSDGGKALNTFMYGHEYLESLKKAGDPGLNWFYFYPSKQQQERWTKKH